MARLDHARENAEAYERIVCGEVIPGIEARKIPGFRHIDLMKTDLGDELEFRYADVVR